MTTTEKPQDELQGLRAVFEAAVIFCGLDGNPFASPESVEIRRRKLEDAVLAHAKTLIKTLSNE